MEALTLQIIGGWEQVTAEITWQRFHVAGKDRELLTEAKKLAKVVREMADEWACAGHINPSLLLSNTPRTRGPSWPTFYTWSPSRGSGQTER